MEPHATQPTDPKSKPGLKLNAKDDLKSLRATGFVVEDSLTESMWVPVEIVRGRKAS